MCSNESILRQPQQEACGDAFTIKHWTFTYLISGRGLGPWAHGPMGHGPMGPWAHGPMGHAIGQFPQCPNGCRRV